jgi:integrase
VDGKWARATTKTRELKAAKEIANRLKVEAEIRSRNNLPVVTRRVRDIARLAVQRMQDETRLGAGRVSYADYIRVINDYIVPCLGSRYITNIDADALQELNEYREAQMERSPTQSTLLTHNAALNRVFDEAELRGFLTKTTRPVLKAMGARSERRPAFTLNEVQQIRAQFPRWIAAGKNAESQERRALIYDYVCVLLDTGARPGKEITQLRWQHVIDKTDVGFGDQQAIVDEETGEVEQQREVKLRRALVLNVDGKTGRRELIARQPTYDALVRIAKRNYPDKQLPVLNRLKHIAVAKNKDYVFRTSRGQDISASAQKMFESFLASSGLLMDAITGQNRVFYSLRHTYATLSLTHDRVPIHTLAKQMGTSVLMIERHYSHLDVVQAMDQLRGEESRALIEQNDWR